MTRHPCRYFSASKGDYLELEAMHSAHLIAARNRLQVRDDRTPEDDALMKCMNQELEHRMTMDYHEALRPERRRMPRC